MSDTAAYLMHDLKARLQALAIPSDASLAVAVSGGADSLALALLLSRRPHITALTVDHGLRPEASEEANYVASTMRVRGIDHHTLTWEGSKSAGNLQAEARSARYRLMADWCKTNKVAYLLTAHHQEDQAETLMLRLARGSGVYGLSAMPDISPLPGDEGVMLVRPLLDVPKAQLKQFLKETGIEWIDDPSNEKVEFDRVKIRRFLQAPPLEGFNAARLGATARRLRRSRDALEFYEAEWIGGALTAHDPAFFRVERSALDSAPEDIVLRALTSVCRYFSGARYVPRLEKIERLLAALRSGGFEGQTLYGTAFRPEGESVVICRELAACEARKLLTGLRIWDNRFEISAKGDTRGLEIGALGESDWRQAVTKWPELRETSVPYAVRLVQPAIFDQQQLRALPLMGYSDMRDVMLHLSQKPLIQPKKCG